MSGRGKKEMLRFLCLHVAKTLIRLIAFCKHAITRDVSLRFVECKSPQLTYTCSKSTIETLKKCVKYQS